MRKNEERSGAGPESGNLPEMPANPFESLRATVETNLASFERRRIDPALLRLRPAAVALTIVADEEGAPCLLITRRSRHLSRHAGQWALPGGGIHEGETPEAAALRELAEEIGLALEPSAVMGKLDDFPTRSGFCITPVACWGGKTPELTADPGEVESIHWIRLGELDRPGVPRIRRRRGRMDIEIPIGNSSVHAPTAAIIYQMREVAIHGRPARVFDFEQPPFAWR